MKEFDSIMELRYEIRISFDVLQCIGYFLGLEELYADHTVKLM